MNGLKNFGKQLVGFSRRQFALMIFGQIVLAIGLSMFNLTGSNHPFHSMLYGAEALLEGVAGGFFSYANLQILLNVVLIVIQIIFGLKYIGLGTVINMFAFGYAMQVCTWLLVKIPVNAVIDWPTAMATGFAGITAGKLVSHVVMLLLSTTITALGLSLYQAGNAGVAAYDAMALILTERTKLPFFWCRMITDGACFIVTLLVAGDIGLGTIVTVFCTGPFIRFFDKTVSCKLIKTPV